MPLETSAPARASRRTLAPGRLALYGVMLLLVILMVAPFGWMLSTSLKAQQYILETPPRLLPDPVTL
ncbi:MAG: carbohydrate ABC transporter permease, partial [Anaerolineae bacterium]|nr:carbohydrate ABC transporter permease [Anaerolineae bacterium]